VEADGFPSAELRNLAWWDGVSYKALENWVPTLGRVPKGALHELALLRGACCKRLWFARTGGDLVLRARAEKLLTYLDRLVLHSPRSKRGGKNKGLGKVVTARVRLAWAGDWAALWREAAGAGALAPQRGNRRETLKEQARNVEAFVQDSLVAKAVARVCRDTPLAVGRVVYEALVALFPDGDLPGAPQLEPTSPELRSRMVAEAQKQLKRWPSRAAPGQNGSRFEHWGSVTVDTESWEAAAQVVVMFALGECSPEFLEANLGARVFALRKPNGKLRPIACGSVLRRLAARVSCAVFREDIQQACGKLQFAVGRRAGCELVHKAISALSCASPQDVVLKFDCTNAFNTMPRELILDAVRRRAPGLLPVVSSWLCRPTTHRFWGVDGAQGLPIRATRGVDQGCPLSPALFAIGLADALECIQSRLATLSPTCRVFSYLDDVMVVVPGAAGVAAMQVVVEALGRIGLTVNAGKTAAWTLDPNAPLPEALRVLRKDKCQVLGATAPWLDPDGDFSRVGVHGLAEGASVVQSAQAFVTKVVELRGAGLSTKAAFLLLQAFSHGHVTHLLRANYEAAGWAKQFDDALVAGLQQLTGNVLDETRRAQCFLRLSEGGLGLGSAEQAAAAAFLGSWALALKEVAGAVGASSWGGFCSRCGPLATSLAQAEAKLLEESAGSFPPVDWVGLLAEPKAKLQSLWSARLQELRAQALRESLPPDDRVDFRSAGGAGAGGFLEPPVLLDDAEPPKAMPDQHFQHSLKDRLRLRVCPPGATCQHRRQNGTLCGQPLDSRGKHAVKCEVGPTREARHDALRDFTADFHPRVSGYVAVKEQRVTAWDRVNPRTGLLEEARLDVATRDAASGHKIFVDACVTCAHSGYEPSQRARAGRDGVAAAAAVRGKRSRYPPSGGELVPLVFEAGGRPADETVAFVRSWATEVDEAERSRVIRYAWQQYSTILQSGNAEMVLSAIG